MKQSTDGHDALRRSDTHAGDPERHGPRAVGQLLCRGAMRTAAAVLQQVSAVRCCLPPSRFRSHGKPCSLITHTCNASSGLRNAVLQAADVRQSPARTAVDSTMLGNETVLAAEVLPFVDGVTATTPVMPTPPPDAPIFTFSASQDPGDVLGRMPGASSTTLLPPAFSSEGAPLELASAGCAALFASLSCSLGAASRCSCISSCCEPSVQAN